MRTPLQPNDEVIVVDWADAGDLFYGELSEDGERAILRPDREAIIQLITARGERWTLVSTSFGEDFDAAAAMVEAIMAKGSVNLDGGQWQRGRDVYGSAVYDGWDELSREYEDEMGQPMRLFW